jgi:TonB-linked SusC/RagA family outer membrane protein
MTRFLSVFMVLMLSGVMALAQNRTVSGTVTDGKGAAVPFASVKIVGTKAGDNADANGFFSIKTNLESGQITVSASGFAAKTVDFIAGRASAVELTRTDASLEAVVVTGVLGIQRQAKSLGYATTKVSGTAVNQAAPVNVANGLQGKVSGLNIATTNSGVFEDVKVQIRGIRSLSGDNQPMLLLDGVITPFSYLATINPRDVVDVNVIKGPSGAGLYGPEARNGVFIVTTKRGNKGEKPSVTLSRTTQFSQISLFPKMQTEFGTGFGGTFVPYENWSWGPRYDGSIKNVGSPLADGSQQFLTYSPTNDRKEFFNTGVTNQTDFSIAAREFYLSFQDVNIKGIVPEDENRRISARLNSDKTFGKFKVNIGMNYIQQNYNVFDDNAMSDFNRNIVGAGLNDGLMNLIFNTAAHIPLKSYSNLNEKYSKYENYFNHYGINPWFAIDNWRTIGKVDNFLGNLDLNYKVSNNLGFTWRVASNFSNQNVERTSKGYKLDATAPNTNVAVPGGYGESSSRSSNLTSELFATFKKKVGDFNVNVVAGNFWRENQFKRISASIPNTVVDGIFNLSNLTGNPAASSFRNKTRLYSLYGQVILGYKNWVTLDLQGRNDWTSTYGPKNRSLFYPSANLSFVLTDAIPALQQNKTLISFLKLRGSLSKSANSTIAPYQLQSTFSGTGGGFPYAIPGFTANNTAFDPELSPEFIKHQELGIELGLFKNRVNIEVAAYKQDNTDQVIAIGTSAATGYTTANRNAASFENRGLDLDLKLTPLVNLGEVRFDLNLNATYNNSKISSIFPGLDRLNVGGFNNIASNFAIVGQPAFVLLATDNVRDAQGRVIVDKTTGLPTQDAELKQFGRTLPLWTAGINPTISWKNIRFSAVAEFKTGHQAYSRIGNEMAWTGVSAATAQNGRERFVYPNSVYDDGTGKLVPNTNIQVNDIESYYTGVYRNVASNFIHSAASWRVREVSLSYALPESLLAGQKLIKGLTFTVNARNLALWVPESNQYTDPDFNFTSTGNANGVTNSQINPPTRIFGFNITANF